MSTIQLGDIIALLQFAEKVYHLGWGSAGISDSSTEYHDVGQECRALFLNLENLVRVVESADDQIQCMVRGDDTRVRWDGLSLLQIIGDCEPTLLVARDLLERNRHYANPGGARRNWSWHLTVADDAKVLLQRLQRHNTKIMLAIAPFELDLLSRIHQDLQKLVTSVESLRVDVQNLRRQLGGVFVEDLEQAEIQQSSRQTYTVPLPESYAEAFQREAAADRPDSSIGDFPLQDLADAFVTHFAISTVSFKPGQAVKDRIPDIPRYTNLLKCTWILGRMQSSAELQNASENSHWPSFVRKLEEVLSEECRRFERRECIAPPDIKSERGPSGSDSRIWKEKAPTRAYDVVAIDVPFEEVLEIKAMHSSDRSEMKLRLERFVRGAEVRFKTSFKLRGPTQQAAPPDIVFDLRKTRINPVYAMADEAPFDIGIETRKEVKTLHFFKPKEVLKYQHALTNYLVLDNAQFSVQATFTMSGSRKQIDVDAILQIWMYYPVASSPKPDRLDGESSRITSAMLVEEPAEASPQLESRAFSPFPGLMTARERTGSVVSSVASSSRSRHASINSVDQRGFQANNPWSPRRGDQSPAERRSSNATRASLSYASPPTSPQPDRRQSVLGLFSRASRLQQPAQRAEGSRSALEGTGVIDRGGGPSRSTMRSSLLPGSRTSTQASTSSIFSMRTPTRASSIAPTLGSTATSSSSDSSSASAYTVTAAANGVLHKAVRKPLLVLLTQDPETLARVVVAVDLDGPTGPNAERCGCRHEKSDCCYTVMERSKGEDSLVARHFGAGGDWDVAALAGPRRPETEWKGVSHVVLRFGDTKDRISFAGTWCNCKGRGKNETAQQRRDCVNKNHRGLIGHAKEYYFGQLMECQKLKDDRQHVILS